MSDNYTSYNTTAHNTGVSNTNTAATVTIANTLSITPPVVVSPDGAHTVVLKIHDSGLMEFRDEQGNMVRSRQKTLRLFVEKLIASGIAS